MDLEGGPEPSQRTAMRLREGYKIVRMIVEVCGGCPDPTFGGTTRYPLEQERLR